MYYFFKMDQPGLFALIFVLLNYIFTIQKDSNSNQRCRKASILTTRTCSMRTTKEFEN